MTALAAAKPRAHYYVVLYQNQWMINLDGKRTAYPTQEAAYLEAVRCARLSHANGYDAQVLVQGTDNKFRVEWTYGHDPYPPRG